MARPLSLAEVAGLDAHLGLELGREVVGALEVETVGDLLDSEVGGGEEFLGAEEPELLLVGGGGETGVVFEELAEVAVADAEFGGDLLDGEGGLEGLADAQTGTVDHIDMQLVLTQLDVALEGVHDTNEMVDDAGHELLGVGGFFYGGFIGALVKGLDDGGVTYVVDGPLGREESGADAVVHIAATETDPVALPADGGEGVVGVPLSGEEEEHVAGLDVDGGTAGALEETFAFGVVEQLVFVERAASLDVEIVAVGMALSGVGFTGEDVLETDGADGKTPEGIAVAGKEVFASLHYLVNSD